MAYKKNNDPQNPKRYERVEYTKEELDAFRNAPANDLLSGNIGDAPEIGGAASNANPSQSGTTSQKEDGRQSPHTDAPAQESSSGASSHANAGESKANNPPPPPQMSRYQEIELCLKDKQNTARLALALGFDAKDDKGKAEAFKYISNVLMEIKKTEWFPGMDPKAKARDLTFCTVDSILQAILDAANFRLPIDGRKLAYLVKYSDTAQFQPGFKGMLYKLSEVHRDVDFTAEPVFEGDKLDLFDKSGYQTYEHKRVSPFQTDESKMQGLVACLAYTTDSGRHSKVVTLAKSEIDHIRKKAKQDFIWNEWYIEKAKAAGLKRLCKIHFASAMGLQELLKYDNEENFIIDATPNGDKVTPANSGGELNKMLEHKPVVPMPPIQPEKKPEAVPVEAKKEAVA